MNDHRFHYNSINSRLPEYISTYKITDTQINLGSQGRVIKAVDQISKKFVAIKILPDEYESYEQSILSSLMNDVYENDIKIESFRTFHIYHANIVQIIDVGNDTHLGPFIVMEWVDGGSLRDLISRSPHELEIDLAINIVNNILEGLEVAHSYGIIHLDIKPENILLDENNIAKISDFGSSVEIDSAGGFIDRGTIGYIAPERLIQKDEFLTISSDIFSVGVILSELLDFKNRILNNDIANRLQEIINISTNKDPNSRYISAKEMQEELEIVLNDIY